MGSATTQAVAASTAALDAAEGVDLEVARELFAAARVLGDSSHLVGALADSAATVEARSAVVASVFGPVLSPVATQLITAVVSQSWSAASDLIDGVEELAVRAAASAAADSDVEGELFAITRVVATNPDLELALGSRMGDDEAKGRLVESLFAHQASAATVLVASSLVRQPRERRVRELLGRGMRLAAAQRGRTVATVHSAVELGAEQQQRLTEALTARYNTQVSLNTVIDPALVGGLRVQIADDVIDGSVASRLSQLRQKLAG